MVAHEWQALFNIILNLCFYLFVKFFVPLHFLFIILVLFLRIPLCQFFYRKNPINFAIIPENDQRTSKF